MGQCQPAQNQISKDLDRVEFEEQGTPTSYGGTLRYDLNRPSRDVNLGIRSEVKIHFHENRNGGLQAVYAWEPIGIGPVFACHESFLQHRFFDADQILFRTARTDQPSGIVEGVEGAEVDGDCAQEPAMVNPQEIQVDCGLSGVSWLHNENFSHTVANAGEVRLRQMFGKIQRLVAIDLE